MRNKTSKNLFKKLVSLVLTMVMVLAMSTTTFAATSDTILSKPDGNPSFPMKQFFPSV